MSKPLVVVTFETGNFRFVTYAATEFIGRRLLRDAWHVHSQQTGADPYYLDEFYDDVNVLVVKPPAITRDGDVWHVGGPGANNQPTPEDVIDFVRFGLNVGHPIGADRDEFNMDEVCALLHYHLGVQAYVEYTGGGCATIYAGGTFRNYGEAGDSDETPIYRQRALGGAGWFTSPMGKGDPQQQALGSWHEFVVGKDDDGESHTYIKDAGVTNTRQIAALIALYVIDAADFDNVTAIGLDATQRGIPQNGA
jgi:hypothetical protein